MENEGNQCTCSSPPPDIHISPPDVSVGSEEPQIQAAQPEVTTINPGGATSPNTKLCGYLSKQGGPLKAWKSRWFTFEEKSCQLFYYRTAQDLNPLGKVDLSRSTLSYPLQGEEGTFHIQTPERTVILKAPNRDAQMYWLQQLQLKRASYREQNAGQLSQPKSDSQSLNGTPSAQTGPADFLPVVKTPPGLVGEEAASLPAPGTNNPLNMSIKHPLIELQNTMRSLLQRQSQEVRQSVFHIDAPCDQNGSQKESSKMPTPESSVNPKCEKMQENGLIHHLSSISQHRKCNKEKSKPSPCSSPVPESSVNPKCEKMQENGLIHHLSSISQQRKSNKEKSKPPDLKETKAFEQTSQLEQEVKAQKELVFILHKVLEAAQLEKQTCVQFLTAEGEHERLELLRQCERRAAELQERLDSLQVENETLRRDLSERDAHISELQENIQLLMQKNQAKQEVILKLSEKLTTCGTDQQCTDGVTSETFKQLTHENENLKDDLKAYKTQNKFLNSEIYQLTTLWRKSSEQEKNLIVKCAVLEANNCQMESRHLGVLQKLQEREDLNPEQREAVRNLIKDMVQANKLNLISDYDEYGFRIAIDYKVEDQKLLSKIQGLEVRSHNLLNHEECDGSLLARCSQLFARTDGELSSSPEVKNLLRTGLPREYRARVWRYLIQTRTRSLRKCYPDRYQKLCEKSRSSPHLVPRQIQLDLDRTLTSNQNFSAPSSPLIPQLERVLQAFSWQNPTIGYVQGLNRLAAIALLVLQNEEDAFWCLVVIVEHFMPQDYYTKGLVGCQADQLVLKDLMWEKLPRLMAHLESQKVDVSLITVEWFLVLFVDSLPSRILFKVWDAFLSEGIKVIFRYALALFKYREEAILKIQDSAEIYQYLRLFPNTIADGRKLTNIAFSDMNPLPMKMIQNRRAVHMERLHAEIKELENLQKAYKAERVRCKDTELDTLTSEDEEEL
ncbi:TBC1 domain family member 2A isoform X2 [Paramisgurnus dabryanus]|uniref:TBC1 domain family member 2A isoform X2 n=1 Tax=Paramisgurnus dabryanus TaxID=90735 RepID=UPI0031F44D43